MVVRMKGQLCRDDLEQKQSFVCNSVASCLGMLLVLYFIGFYLDWMLFFTGVPERSMHIWLGPAISI